jgi:hypothetical protein
MDALSPRIFLQYVSVVISEMMFLTMSLMRGLVYVCVGAWYQIEFSPVFHPEAPRPVW